MFAFRMCKYATVYLVSDGRVQNLRFRELFGDPRGTNLIGHLHILAERRMVVACIQWRHYAGYPSAEDLLRRERSKLRQQYQLATDA